MTKYDYIVDWIKNQWPIAIALIILVVLMAIPQVRDGIHTIRYWLVSLFKRTNKSENNAPPIVDVNGERITFTEMIRSSQFDVIKVHAHTHSFGINAEYIWINHRYPKYEFLKQTLTTLELMSGKSKYETNQIHFDVITIQLPNGKKKEIYFDISSFFSGATPWRLPHQSFVAKKIKEIYK
ncbi:MAG: hypothetical protein P8Y85_03140 [Nitrospirota bacterium]|jgi:hypothetical protein